MMTYQKMMQEIKKRAEAIGVTVKPSTRTGKKFDAFKDGVYQASFGASGYMDYHLYKIEYGEQVAEQKRKAYKARHEKNRHIKYRDGKMTAGYLADKILW
jgi:hypothetical protein